MKKVHFKRQGVANSFHFQYKNLFCRVVKEKDGNYLICIELKHIDEKSFSYYKRIYNGQEKTFEDAKRVIENVAINHLGLHIKIEDFIEAYTYYYDKMLRIHPHLKNDVYLNQAVYDRQRDAVKKVPECFLMISWKDNSIYKPVIMAPTPYRNICQFAHKEFLKNHNQRRSDRENKEWLAWLISELIKEDATLCAGDKQVSVAKPAQ